MSGMLHVVVSGSLTTCLVGKLLPLTLKGFEYRCLNQHLLSCGHRMCHVQCYAHEYLLTQPWSLTSLPQFHVQVKSITPTFTPVRPLLLPLMLLHQMVQFWINLSTAYLVSLSFLTLLTLAVYDLVEQFSLIPKLPIPTTPLSSTLPAAFQTIFPEHSSHFATAS